MSTAGGSGREEDTGRPSADDSDLLRLCRRGRDLRQEMFEGSPGIDRALGMAAVHEFIDAALLTADAGSNFFHMAGISFAGPVRVGQKRAAQHLSLIHI